jgi:hypothetical protein
MGNKKPDIAKKDWNEDFKKELLKRRREFAEGTVKTYAWEETKKAAKDGVAAKVTHR